MCVPGSRDTNGQGSPTSLRPELPAPKIQTDQMRVMVAGESGLGKTTFLNNIFRHLVKKGEKPMDSAPKVQARGGGMFGQSKTLRIEERAFSHKVTRECSQKGQLYNFFMVDTPGYGDHVNTSKSFQPVVDYIIAGNKKYLADIASGNDNPIDGRTDVCIYFIAAHRCKPIDVEYMRQLSKVVAVIPVIGKSDSMTVNEMRDFKREIVRLAADSNDLEFFKFSEPTWRACRANLGINDSFQDTASWLGEQQPPPYAVISSQVDDSDECASLLDPDDDAGPARIYHWGTCHVMEPKYSDNTYLRSLLLGVGFQDMKNEMRRRHGIFRQEQRIIEARTFIEKIVEAVKSLLRRLSSAVAPQHTGGAMAALGGMVMIVIVFALGVLAAGWWVSAPTQADNICEIPTFACGPEGTCDANTQDNLTCWNEVIGKIQKLVADESGEELLDVLIDMLNDYSKNTGAAQGDTVGYTVSESIPAVVMDKSITFVVTAAQETTSTAPIARGRKRSDGAKENSPITMPDDAPPSEAAVASGGQEEHAATSVAPAEEGQATSVPSPATGGTAYFDRAKESGPTTTIVLGDASNSEATPPGGQEDQLGERPPLADEQESFITVAVGMCLLVLMYIVEWLRCLGEMLVLLLEEYWMDS